MAILTEEQKKAYLKNPSRCPFCKSNNISGGEIDMESLETWQHCSCDDCHEEWMDIYKLCSVETQEELDRMSGGKT